jgi:predicted RecB family nuclease
MVKNPALGQQAALAAPYEKSKGAMSRGTTVHSIVEAYKHTQEQLDVVEEFRPYAKAFYKFITDRNMVFVSQERTVISKKYRYAGTLDLLASIDKNPTPLVIDVKTGKDIYEESFLQTAAYRNAITEEGVSVRGIGTLLLKDNGEYKFEDEVEDESYKYRLRGFLAAKEAYEGKNYNMLKKVGYL